MEKINVLWTDETKDNMYYLIVDLAASIRSPVHLKDIVFKRGDYQDFPRLIQMELDSKERIEARSFYNQVADVIEKYLKDKERLGCICKGAIEAHKSAAKDLEGKMVNLMMSEPDPEVLNGLDKECTCFVLKGYEIL